MSDLTAFRRAVDAIEPGATGSKIAALLDHKAKRTTVLQWYAGRWHAPQWALHLLARKIRADALPRLAIADQLDNLPDRPGKSVGAKNLAAYLARR